MFDNLTKEIIFYSLIPVLILALVCLILIIIKKKNNNSYKFNYLIKILLMLIDSLVLSILIGYSVWATVRFIRNNSLSSNFIYVLIFVILISALIILLIITCNKLYRDLNTGGIELDEKETF